MKKTLIILLSIIGTYTTALAQRFNFRLGAGYAIPFATPTTDASGNLYSGTMTRTTVDSVDYDAYKVKKASFTSGTHLALGLGYMFNEYVGIDASIDLCVSPQKNVFDINNVMVGSIPRNVEFIQKASLPIMLTPALVMQTGGKNINLYSRVGVVVPCNTKIIWDRIFTTLPGYGAITTDDETWEIRNKFSLGMSAVIGMQKKVSEKVKIGAELSFLSMSIVTKQAKLTQFTKNGKSYNIANEPDSLTTINFSSNFKSTSNNFNEQPAYAQPFSNLAMNVSMTLSVGGNSKRRLGNKNSDANGAKRLR